MTHSNAHTTCTDYFRLFMARRDIRTESDQVCALFGVDNIEDLQDILFADLTIFAQFFAFFVDIRMSNESYSLLYKLESCIITLNPRHVRKVPATQYIKVTPLQTLLDCSKRITPKSNHTFSRRTCSCNNTNVTCNTCLKLALEGCEYKDILPIIQELVSRNAPIPSITDLTLLVEYLPSTDIIPFIQTLKHTKVLQDPRIQNILQTRVSSSELLQVNTLLKRL